MTCRIHSDHEHHLTPKFQNGLDLPENLVVVPDVCHAMWHWNEWRRTRIPEHKGAYHLLVGQLLGESTSDRMKRLWADPETKAWLLECRKDTIRKLQEEGYYSKLGKTGGKVAAKSDAMKKAKMSPHYIRSKCVQRSPELVPLLDRWLTFKHTNGSTFSAKFDYSTKVITQKLSILSGKSCSPSRWTKLFTEGETVAGWVLTSVSI